jgi:hypothetical protein
MPQIPTVPDQKPTATKQRPLLVPPEEQFWKRYSPHNEFPLSNATSIALHVIAIGLILLIAYLIDLNREKKPDNPVATLEPVVMGDDSSGNQKGGGQSGGNDGGRQDLPKENVDGGDGKTENSQPSTNEGPTLEDPREAPPVEVAKDGTQAAPITDVQKNLSELGKRAQETLRQAQATQGKRKGRRDTGGGRDGDKGPGQDRGKDIGKGPGRSAELARKRAARQLRWRLVFNRNSDGPDYRDKLKALRAILVVAEFKRGLDGRPILNNRGQAVLQYRLVIRDIGPHAHPRPENVNTIRGIFWIDDKPESVRALAEALGLRQPPPLFACFFPERVEMELRQREREKYPGDEEKIFETHFHVELTGGSGYQLICDEVVLKR